MATDLTTIDYVFHLPTGARELFSMSLDRKTLTLIGPRPIFSPSWTRLEFHQCSHCPLRADEHPYCPLAAVLVPVVHRFDGLLSFDRVDVEVVTEERRVSQEISVQRGVGSLIGLLTATSGCPHTEYFKPMARFHLPFASIDETVYRAVSMYLFAQYFLSREGQTTEWDLRGLQVIYRNMQIVNAGLVERIRSVTGTDSSVNAVLVLDVYARLLDSLMDASIEQLKPMFQSYLAHPPGLLGKDGSRAGETQ